MPKWIPTTVDSSLTDLLRLTGEVERINGNDPWSDALHFLSNWLLVRSCGHIEIVEQACIEDLFDRCFGGAVHHYVDCTSFRSGRNPSYTNLKGMLDKIDKSGGLSESFKEFINSDYSDGLTSSGERGTYKNYLQCMIDGRNAIVHGYSFQLSYINAIVYPRIAISISDWYLTQFSPGGAAERIITSDELQRSDSINVVRRERAARNLGIGEDASATSLD